MPSYTGTLTASQGARFIDVTPNDVVSFTTTGTYTVEYPVGTVAINASTSPQSLTANSSATQMRVLCVSGSVTYSNVDNSDSTALTPAESVAVRSLVSGAGSVLAPARFPIFPDVAPVIASSNVTGLSTATVMLDGAPALAITATGGTSGWVECQWHTLGTTFAGDSAVVEYQGDPNVWTALNVFLAESSAYSIFALAAQNFAAPTDGSPINHNGTHAYCPTSALWAKTGYTRGTEEQIWGAAKLRINIANGATGTFYLRGFGVGAQRAWGRLAITIDDGYSSIYRLGLPILEMYGLRASLGIIPSLIGTAGFMTVAQLQDAKARGHQIIPHGPESGVGNLFSRWATDAEALADVLATRDWIRANNLDSPDGAAGRVYIYPQGRYARTAGQASFVQALRGAGFRVGRTANPSSNTVFLQGRSTSRDMDGRLTQGIIGHTYAGTNNNVTSSADNADETTNITTITNRITSLRNDRKDGWLMLHDFCRRGAAFQGSLFIETDRLHTICAAIRTGIEAGDLRNVLAGDLADVA